MSEETQTQPAVTTIKTVSVKVSRRIDLGYVPYIEYLKSLKGKPAPFGTRDNSNTEVDLFVSAEVGLEDSVEEAIARLSMIANTELDRILHTNYADAFQEARQIEAPEELFVVGKTQVAAPTGEF